MALRVCVYVGLLYQHLLSEKRVGPDGRLPPVVPIVLYNGRPRWTAPLELAELATLGAPALSARARPDPRTLRPR
jgi:hypothetical protein